MGSAHLFLGWISDSADHPVELIPHSLGSDSSSRRFEVLHVKVSHKRCMGKDAERLVRSKVSVKR